MQPWFKCWECWEAFSLSFISELFKSCGQFYNDNERTYCERRRRRRPRHGGMHEVDSEQCCHDHCERDDDAPAEHAAAHLSDIRHRRDVCVYAVNAAPLKHIQHHHHHHHHHLHHLHHRHYHHLHRRHHHHRKKFVIAQTTNENMGSIYSQGFGKVGSVSLVDSLPWTLELRPENAYGAYK